MNINEMMETSKEKEMLLNGLVRVMYADGKLTNEEEQFLSQLSVSLGNPSINIEAIRKEKMAITFENTKTCMFFLTQAVQLCYVDNDYDDAEREELSTICDEMGISQESLGKVEKWVQEGIEWNKKGMELLRLK